MNLLELAESVNELRYKKAVLEGRLDDYERNLKDVERRIEGGEKGRAALQEIAKTTQLNLEVHVSNLVTTAIKSVDDSWPDFRLEFVPRRNTVECDVLFVEEEGEGQDPLGSSGFGAVDVASFGQRVAYWTLNPNRPCFILDEPFRNVSPDLQHRVSDMLEMISKELGVQIIMVSHAEEINVAANKTFSVSKKKGKSEVKEII
jgi:hypothetical protein